ncbi:MAG: response regulator [Omnitrophica bacterium]|nr:response regulator [Candidatus Omnitrophota bacterium]
MSKVLIVDDEVEVVDFLCNFLKRFEISSEKAVGGQQALEVFKTTKPGWVFLDIKMADMDGLEVLQELKRIDPKAGVIMITGRDDKESQDKAKKLGALDYIVKPLDLEELHQKIQTYILKK